MFRQEYNRILNYITDRDLGMRCRPNGVDLLFFSSKKLPLNDQSKFISIGLKKKYL